ncbi:MAG: ATP-binding cassette domain-containing protein, partial [Acutalibacter sp.]|nr:ATP-binding cassette domain-containing protein [Acutalibacter sp.]
MSIPRILRRQAVCAAPPGLGWKPSGAAWMRNGTFLPGQGRGRRSRQIMPTIRLEHASKIFKGHRHKFETLRDVNLTVEQGEFVFIVGSRGAGSTTLLDMIAGDLPPDDGVVYLDHFNLDKLNRRQQKKLPYIFGRVPQESALVRSATVYDNMCSMKKMERLRTRLVDEPRMKKALGLVGMAGC